MAVTPQDVVKSLTPDQQSSLAKLALQSSNELGYCSETRNVLDHMGFDVNHRIKYKVVVELELELDFGSEIEDDKFEISSWQDGDPYFGLQEVLNVEEIPN